MLTVLLTAIKKETFWGYAVRGSVSDSGALLSKGAIFHVWNNKSLALNFNKS